LQDAEGSGGCLGWAARDKSAVLAPLRFGRRELQPHDIHIQITHAGGWAVGGRVVGRAA